MTHNTFIQTTPQCLLFFKCEIFIPGLCTEFLINYSYMRLLPAQFFFYYFAIEKNRNEIIHRQKSLFTLAYSIFHSPLHIAQQQIMNSF